MRKGSLQQKGMVNTRCSCVVLPIPVLCSCGMPFVQAASVQGSTGGGHKRQTEAPATNKDKKSKVDKDQFACRKCGKIKHVMRNCPDVALFLRTESCVSRLR